MHTSTAYTRLMEVCESEKSTKRCNPLGGGGTRSQRVCEGSCPRGGNKR